MRRFVHRFWRGSRVVAIVLHARSFSSDEEIDAYLADLRPVLADPEQAARFGALVISDGGVPTASQRAAVTEAFGAHEFPWALIATSRLARGVANAFAWRLAGLRAFAPAQFRAAAEHLGVRDDELASLWQAVRDADQGLGLETVAAIEL